MQNHAFPELLHEYRERLTDLAVTLVAVNGRASIFEELKLFIQASRSRNELGQAAQAEQLAWLIAQQSGEQEERALAHWCSLIFYFDRDVKRALDHADAAHHYYTQTGQMEKEGRVLIGIANQLTLLGALDKAEDAIQRSIICLSNNPDYRDWPIIYLNLAYIQIQQGRYHEAKSSAQKAVALAIAFGEQKADSLLRYQWMCAQALVNQGLAALFLGQLGEAEATVTEALTLAQRYGFANVAGRAALNLARLSIIKGEMFTALQVLRAAKENIERPHGDGRSIPYSMEEAYLYIEEAQLYQRLMMTHRACQAAIHAATAFAQSGLSAGHLEAILLAVRLAIKLREPGRAYTYLLTAKEHLATAPPVHQALWHVYVAHPAFQKDRDQRQQALTAAEQAMATLQHLEARNEALEAALIVAQLASELTLPDAKQRLQEIADEARHYDINAIEQEACIQLAQSEPARSAIPHLRRAADISQQVRTQMPVEELKANLLTGHSGLYTQLIEAQLKNRKPVAALETLFEAKGGLWLDLMTLATPQPSRSAWAELMFWRDELRAASEAAYRVLCQAKIQAAEAVLADAVGTPPQERRETAIPDLSTIQAALPTETVILEYLIGATHIVVCLINATQPPQWVRLCKSRELQPLLERLTLLLADLHHCPTAQQRRTTAQAQLPWSNTLLAQFYQYLIAPITDYLPHTGTLVIVPDGYLFEIPWAALTNGQITLREQYYITLAPSAALFTSQHLTKAKTAVGYGRPRALGYAGEPPLVSVTAELAAIQQAFPEVLLVNPATTADLQWTVSPRFLHISAHGRVQRHAPLLSALTLADGPFLLADVFKLPLQGTQFVTLSACETGIMPEQGGVLLALAGAFLCAGAQTVLASLWSVDDEATQLLMSTLYASLQNSLTPVQALQRAQDAVFAAGYQHPFYWAAFQPLSRII